MVLSIRMSLCLLCGALAAAAAQQKLNQNVHPAVDRFRGQRPDQMEVQQPAAIQQEEQSLHEPLSWRYPDPPTKEAPRFPLDFELSTPIAAESVSAVCGENSVRVEAKRDLLGIGKLVQAEDITLGGCAATGEDPEVLIFESELHGCGSQFLMSEESLVYIFTLSYTPSPLGGNPIVRTRDVTVSIQCHYQRKHDVSSGVLKPTWVPLTDSKVSEESLHFSLSLMTDDWQLSRPSTQFVLGDMMKLEASVKQFHHVPLRVTVDSCIATVVPNVDTVPRYTFVGNYGCLFDSRLTSTHSQFLPRSQDDKLRFMLQTFRFQQDDDGMLYITCSLRATAAAAAVDATSKACSFSSRWTEASGNHHACSCCDTVCGTGGKSDLNRTGAQWEEEKTIGPIIVREASQVMTKET